MRCTLHVAPIANKIWLDFHLALVYKLKTKQGNYEPWPKVYSHTN